MAKKLNSMKKIMKLRSSGFIQEDGRMTGSSYVANRIKFVDDFNFALVDEVNAGAWQGETYAAM